MPAKAKSTRASEASQACEWRSVEPTPGEGAQKPRRIHASAPHKESTASPSPAQRGRRWRRWRRRRRHRLPAWRHQPGRRRPRRNAARLHAHKPPHARRQRHRRWRRRRGNEGDDKSCALGGSGTAGGGGESTPLGSTQGKHARPQRHDGRRWRRWRQRRRHKLNARRRQHGGRRRRRHVARLHAHKALHARRQRHGRWQRRRW